MSAEVGTAEREARTAWSALAEPGDRDAGRLVAALGAHQALAWVRRGVVDLGAAASDLRGLAPDHARGIVAAHERWARRLDVALQPHAARAAAIGARVVVSGDLEWPRALDDLGDAAPFALWVRGEGDLASLWERSVAVVGSRAATAYGEHCAASLAGELADAGWTVVSGGAYGIDAAAHRAALTAGATVAVMAGGVDRLYPAGNDELLRRVLERGCVISEVPPGFAPHRSRFLARNRLIATARATVVVEAAWRSGALSTAHHAAELCRPVAAVPGPVTSAASTGCHRLIRDGAAVLVTHAGEVIELAASITDELPDIGRDPRAATSSKGAKPAPPEFATPHERAAYDALGRRPARADQIAAVAGLGLRDALAALGSLELRGLAASDSGGWTKAPQTP